MYRTVASVSWCVSYCNFAGDTQLAYGYPTNLKLKEASKGPNLIPDAAD